MFQKRQDERPCLGGEERGHGAGEGDGGDQGEGGYLHILSDSVPKRSRSLCHNGLGWIPYRHQSIETVETVKVEDWIFSLYHKFTYQLSIHST